MCCPGQVRGSAESLANPGQGTTDWLAFLAALDAMQFTGLRTFESATETRVDEMLLALAELGRAWNHDFG